MSDKTMYKKLLGAGQKTYDQGKKAAEQMFKPFPTAMYKLQLQKIGVRDVDTVNGVALVANVQWLCLEGGLAKQVCFTSLFLTGEKSDQWIHAFFMSLDSEAPANKADLLGAFDALVKAAPIVIAKVTETDDGYNRIRVREVVGNGDPVDDTDNDSDNDTEGAGELAEWAGRWGYEVEGLSEDEVLALVKEDEDNGGKPFPMSECDDDDVAMIQKYDLEDKVDGWESSEEEEGGEEEEGEEEEEAGDVDERLAAFAVAWGYDEDEVTGCEDTDALVELIKADDDNGGKPFPYADCDDNDKAILKEFNLTGKVDGWPKVSKKKAPAKKVAKKAAKKAPAKKSAKKRK